MELVLKIALINLCVVGLIGCKVAVTECSNPLGDIEVRCIPAEVQKLDSYGGLIYPAFDIAIRTQTTLVTRYCHSACVVIAMAADHRYACHNAQYGLHRVTTDHGQKDMEEFFLSDERADGPWLVWASSTTPSHQLYRFGPYVAKQVGIVDEIIYCED